MLAAFKIIENKQNDARILSEVSTNVLINGNLKLHHNGYSFYEFIAQQQLLGIF